MDQLKTGKFISSLRKEAYMTQEMLGEKLCVTNKTVSRWETGSYMPDIDTLKLLSELFSVSIDELISGERINGGSSKTKADNNTTPENAESNFSLKEKAEYWKHKWIKQHTALIVAAVVMCAVIFLFAVIKPIAWLAGAVPLIGLVAFGFLRNRMMAYIEDKLYDT